MDHIEVPQLLGLLAAVLGVAKLLGAAAKRIGQPAVLGELLAGVLLGTSVAGLVDPHNEILHVLAELGVVILLFEIGLETDVRKLLQVGGTSAVVAIVGVALPFALGYAVCRGLGQSNLVAIVAGATLTATSVGITGRVLADLNRLQETESRIILGAAVIDDVIGLVILAVVSGLTQGQEVTPTGVPPTHHRQTTTFRWSESWSGECAVILPRRTLQRFLDFVVAVIFCTLAALVRPLAATPHRRMHAGRIVPVRHHQPARASASSSELLFPGSQGAIWPQPGILTGRARHGRFRGRP